MTSADFLTATPEELKFKITSIETALKNSNERENFLTSSDEIALIKALHVIQKDVKERSGEDWKEVSNLTNGLVSLLKECMKSLKSCGRNMADAFIRIDKSNAYRSRKLFDLAKILVTGEAFLYSSKSWYIQLHMSTDIFILIERFHPFNAIATPQEIFDDHRQKPQFKRFLDSISNERDIAVIRKKLVSITLPGKYWQRFSTHFGNLGMRYPAELFNLLLYLSMVKSGDEERDFVIHTEARRKTEEFAHSFPRFKPIQALHSVLKWKAEKMAQTIAKKSLVPHTSILLNPNTKFPNQMVKLWKAIISRTNDLVELSHWKLSLSELSLLVPTNDLTLKFVKNLDEVVSITDKKILNHPKLSETIWNPQIPATSIIVRGKIDSDIILSLIWLALLILWVVYYGNRCC